MDDLSQFSPIVLGGTGSLLAGLGTAVGALPVFFMRSLSPYVQNIMLGFAAGIMLSASFFSLILPGVEAAAELGAGPFAASGMVGAGILAGAVLLWTIHHFVPHEHFVAGREGPPAETIKRIWLFVIAITLHNFPEGMAVGVGFGGGDVARGSGLVLGIGLQNAPEGLAVAMALLPLNYSRTRAFLLASLTGLVEPIGGLSGAAAVTIVESLLPWGLAFAAGAMLFVISDEIIPETHRKGLASNGTAGLMVGVVVMMILDVALG